MHSTDPLDATVRQLALLDGVRVAVRNAQKAETKEQAIALLGKAMLDLVDAVLPLTGVCPQCLGSGSYPPPTRKICNLCHGLRVIQEQDEQTDSPPGDQR